MKRIVLIIYFPVLILSIMAGCENKTSSLQLNSSDTSLINTKHLDDLLIPVTFPDSVHGAGIYIYSEAPDYHVVGAKDEGFTCVDDVARAALVYARNKNILSDTASQNKLFHLVHFILEMQSDNGYFYNFILPGDVINKNGKTSQNNANWWSWRAFQTLAEVSQVIKKINSSLAAKVDLVVSSLIIQRWPLLL